MTKAKKTSKKNNAIFSANSILERKLTYIPVSPNIDIMLNGGLVDGSFTLMSGPPKCGKTVTALQAAASAQKLGKKLIYIDAEGRIKGRDIQGIKGLDLSDEKFQVVGHTKNKILDAHEFIETAENILRTNENIFMIFDSFSQLCPHDLRTHDLADRYRDYTPVLLSQFTKRIAGILSINNNSLIGIVHLISNQNPRSMKMYVESGGRKIQYAYDTKLVAKFFEKWVYEDKQIGQKVHWICETSAGGFPNQEAMSYIRYGEGIDIAAELFELARELGVIKSNGTWLLYNDENTQGKDNFIFRMRNEKELFDSIKKEINELMIACE